MTGNGPHTVVLIHGLWLTARSWDKWAERYSNAGYDVIAESWPGLDVEVEALRRDPTPLAGLGLGDVIDHYSRIIDGLDAPPILVGHSFGGTITQVLLDRGYGAAGVTLGSAAVKGVRRLPLSTLRAGWPVLKNPANRKRAVPLSAKQFRWRFTNDLDPAAAHPLYEHLCIPATGRVLFEGGLANFTRRAVTTVRFDNPNRAPLLFLAGENDHVSPPALVRSNFKRQRRSGAVTEFEILPGRTHLMAAENGWELVADKALSWAVAKAGTPTPPPTAPV